jgi:hypothetical protein
MKKIRKKQHINSTVEKKEYGRNPQDAVPAATHQKRSNSFLAGSGRKGTCFCRNMVPAKRNSWKSTLKKKEYGKEFLFLQ